MEPDGYVIVHHRAAGSSTLYFGPFITQEEAFAWMDDVGDKERVNGMLIPLYLTVDWRR